MKRTKTKAHVIDEQGRVLYTRLWDADGHDVLRFDAGCGYMRRSELAARGWTLGQGWPSINPAAHGITA